MNRRGFFETVAFTILAMFVRRSTQAKLLRPKLEGRLIPRGLYISQVVGRGVPVYPQEPIKTVKLRSVVTGQSILDFPPLELGEMKEPTAAQLHEYD